MGRMEALVVAALGRSPYEEQLVRPQTDREPSGVVSADQKYDDRGHPINLETRQRMRNHVRASNEVMQAAGIIEEMAEANARDTLFQNTLRIETEIGLRRLEVGRVLLVAGVWGVCGLRRRIMLYKSYSSGFLEILRQERAQHSIPHILGAGMPALVAYQCAEWVGLLGRAMVTWPSKELRFKDFTWRDWAWYIFHTTIDWSFGYVMVHYQMFAILQQLNLISSKKLFPSLRSLIPFSQNSPLQFPPSWPTSYSPPALLSWSVPILISAAPLLLVLAHTAVNSLVSSLFYGTIYRSLPRPVNRRESEIKELSDNLRNVEQHAHNLTADGSPSNHTSAPAIEVNPPSVSSIPSQHAPTLQALEGRPAPPTAAIRDDSSDDEDPEMSQQTIITFDVEPTETSEAAMGTWSAELRSANEPPVVKETAYQVTALTMLPPLLAAEGLSSTLASTLLIHLEASMVRTVARSFRRSAGLGTQDMFGAGGWITWRTFANLVAAQAVELAVTGVVWAMFTMGSQVWAGKYPGRKGGDIEELEDD